MSCLITMCDELLIMKYRFQKLRKMTYFRIWKGYPPIRDLTRNIVRDLGKGKIYWRDMGFDRCLGRGIHQYLGTRCGTAGKESGFPERDDTRWDAGFSWKSSGNADSGSLFNNLLFAFTSAVTRHLMYANKRRRMGKEERGSRKKRRVKSKDVTLQNGCKTQTASIRRY